MKKNYKLQYTVKKEIELLEFLYENVDKAKNVIKSFLKNKCITVNNKVTTKHDYKLFPNDIIDIKLLNNEDLDIIYEDNEIIVLNKRSGLLTIATNKEKEKTLYHMVSNYVKSVNSNTKIYVVHRLDKDTSGIVMFAKNERIKKLLQNNWNDIVTHRKYVALTEGNNINDSGTIKSYLKENNSRMVYLTNKNEGKLAITHYKKIKQNKKYKLLDIEIETGRKNQIRVQLNQIGLNIVGDKKYGYHTDPIKRLCLHSYLLEFIHTINKKKMHFETNIPNSFMNLVK